MPGVVNLSTETAKTPDVLMPSDLPGLDNTTHDDSQGINMTTVQPPTSYGILATPMARYFTVTAAFGFVALLALLAYYVISGIERKRAMLQERRAHTMVAVGSDSLRRPSGRVSMDAGPAPSKTHYSIPIVMRGHSKR